MIPRIFNHWLFAELANKRIIGSLAPHWHLGLRKIREDQKQICLLFCKGIRFEREFLHRSGVGFHLLLECGGILLLGAEFTDFFAQAVPLTLQGLKPRLGGTTAYVYGQNGIYGFRMPVRTGGESGFSEVGLFP